MSEGHRWREVENGRGYCSGCEFGLNISFFLSRKEFDEHAVAQRTPEPAPSLHCNCPCPKHPNAGAAGCECPCQGIHKEEPAPSETPTLLSAIEKRMAEVGSERDSIESGSYRDSQLLGEWQGLWWAKLAASDQRVKGAEPPEMSGELMAIRELKATNASMERELASLRQEMAGMRERVLEEAAEACVAPKEFCGGPSQTRIDAWYECAVAIRALAAQPSPSAGAKEPKQEL